MKIWKLAVIIFVSFGLGIAISQGFFNKTIVRVEKGEEQDEEAGSLELSKQSQDTIALKIGKVQLAAFNKEISVIGQIAQDVETSVHVISPVNGEIIDTKAQIGSIVNKDDVLCTVSKINGEIVFHEVKAPITGTVIGIFAKNKDRVDAVSAIFTIADLIRLWANFDVYEKDVADIKMGQKVLLNSTAYPDKTFEGEIVFISPRVDESSHTIKIRAIVDNKNSILKLGMFVSGKIISESDKKYLSVSAHATQEMGNKLFKRPY